MTRKCGRCLLTLQKTHAGTGFMHEAFNKDDPSKFTRSWFAWANTIFGELVLKSYKERPHRAELIYSNCNFWRSGVSYIVEAVGPFLCRGSPVGRNWSMADLYLLDENGAMAQRWEIGDQPVAVGRDKTADVTVRDDTLSRRHFLIWREEEGFLIKDLNSQNGTWVDGQRAQVTTAGARCVHRRRPVGVHVLRTPHAVGTVASLRRRIRSRGGFPCRARRANCSRPRPNISSPARTDG